jgi:hypothetical protein
MALAVDDFESADHRAPLIEDWQITGLPWIALWLKELLIWGTLDPVAAFLLARGIVTTRGEAEGESRAYYEGEAVQTDPNEALSLSAIQQWVQERFGPGDVLASNYPADHEVTLTRDFSRSQTKSWRVLPVDEDGTLRWIDVGGYELARSVRPHDWLRENALRVDFTLDSAAEMVRAAPYV